MPVDFPSLIGAVAASPEGIVEFEAPAFASPEARDAPLAARGDPPRESGPEALIVMLHGFDFWSNHAPGKDFTPAVDRMRRHYAGGRFEVIAPTYDTHRSFAKAAAELAPRIATVARGRPLVLFGYSMGGLVARQMVADGLQRVEKLFTFCTPHWGTARWIPLIPNEGAQSMSPASRDLATLMEHPVDVARRDEYHLMGLCYQEAANGRWHMNDGMVEAASQVMGDWGRNPARVHMWKSLTQTTWAGLGMTPHAVAQASPEIDGALHRLTLEVPR